ncbi:ABC transporter permease [Leptospira sp. GIMC2001]|uniref:ABC transporter permease n=1 Tax=Leptospira sp. GIMC2001 TaxID=1513297 RepID=UPI00234A0477|nr:ABC transporter permease [Leptospira sp. GIMC2001]WCL49015.1 ABC transporter permease [Leptospira sp. GIMC2001]
MSLIKITNLSKFYATGAEQMQVLKSVSLEVEEGEFVAIMGASGSGKSTLLQILGLLDGFDSGNYLLNGVESSGLNDEELAKLRSDTIGFVFQQFHLLPRTAAWENVSLPSLYSGDSNPKPRAIQLLKTVGLGDRTQHKPNQLSGGQQQRVAIARSLMNHPKILLADEPTGNLDSKSKIEIMQILTGLNDQGKTIVMVTHEEDIASYCSRIIQFRDGEIIRDAKNPSFKKTKLNSSINSNTETADFHHTAEDLNFEKVARKNLDVFKGYFVSAAKTLVANKARTLLSALGILFGVAAVIVVMALGEGARISIEKQLSSMGSNLLMVRSGASRSGGVALEAGAVARMTLEDVRLLEKNIPRIDKISGTVNGRAQSVYLNKNWNTQIMGTEANYSYVRNLEPTQGRFFTEEENSKRALVGLIGETVRRELFGDSNPVGEFIKLNRIHFRVIGVLPIRGGSSWRDQDDVVMIPIQTAMRRLLNRDTIDGIEMEISSAEEMASAEASIRTILNRRHNPSDIPGNLFLIQNMADIQSAVNETNQTMSALLIAIAAVSLIVGGIGIMNIMLVSVKERTREIGLRKAIGARKQDILIQFLIESVFISIFGGILGILCGQISTELLSSFSGWDTSISTSSIFLSLGFSSITGIIFGLWPANIAANLNPITALRYE